MLSNRNKEGQYLSAITAELPSFVVVVVAAVAVASAIIINIVLLWKNIMSCKQKKTLRTVTSEKV